MTEFKIESEIPFSFNGFSKIGGGIIPRNISVAGMAEITNNVECGDIQVSGTLRARGNIISHGKMSNAGVLRVDGSVELHGTFDSSGSSTFRDKFSCYGNLTSSGLLKCRGKVILKAKALFHGATRIQSDVISNSSIESNGVTIVRGNVAAHSLKVWPYEAGLKIKPLKKLTESVIHGNVLVKDLAEIKRTRIYGDLYAFSILIGEDSNVEGTIYYVDSIEVDSNVSLPRPPKQISRGEFEQAIEKYFAAEHEEFEQIREPLFCPGCGQPLDEPSKFCPFCGISLRD
ncbi:MAG: hypothetical protein ACTSYI_12135 [Promethearchaeota archaeon]